MAIGCGAQCAKILLIIFNIVFWLSGAALLGLGIWMFVDDDISNYIKVFQAFEDGGAFIRYASIVFICVGAFVLIVGFLGCCGAIKESRCMLGMYIFFLVIIMAAEIAAAVIVIFFRGEYIFCLVIIMAAEIAAAVFVLIFRNKVMNDLEKEMKDLIEEHYGNTDSDTAKAFTEGMDYLQIELKCCGITGQSDYSHLASSERPPWSCCDGVANQDTKTCNTNEYNTEGCKQKIEDWVKENSVILMVVGFIVAGIEIFGFIFAICLCRNVGEED